MCVDKERWTEPSVGFFYSGGGRLTVDCNFAWGSLCLGGNSDESE